MAHKIFYNIGEYTPAHRLPKNVRLAALAGDIDPDYYMDNVSDTYGYCISSCNINVLPDTKTVEVTDIKWDREE